MPRVPFRREPIVIGPDDPYALDAVMAEAPSETCVLYKRLGWDLSYAGRRYRIEVNCGTCAIGTDLLTREVVLIVGLRVR